MKSKETILRWLAAGTVFAAALLSSAGCSSSKQTAEMAPDSASFASEAEEKLAASLQPDMTESAQLVNVFGEFPGTQPRASAAGGDVAFQQHTACDEGYDADVAVDPAGKYVAFTSTRHSDRSDIYLQRVDGASVVQLTMDPADDVQPAFSPDGKRIAFCSTRAGNWDIYIMDAEGRNVEQVTNSAAHEMHPSFSPDGTRLIYCALSSRTDQWDLWVINLSTHERKVVGQGLFPVWSPRKDVDRIAFQRARQRGSRWFSLWTMDLVDGEPRRLTEIAASSNAAVIWPTWSPDGAHLAFATVLAPASPSAEKAAPRQDIWVVSSDGTGRRRLTQGGGSNFSPFWAVDNRIYFISDRGGRENVWSVRPDSGNVTFAATDRTTSGAPKEHASKTEPAHAAPAKTGSPHPPTAVGSTDSGEVGH